MTAGCPKHPEQFSRSCIDVRCQAKWSPPGAPTPEEQMQMWLIGKSVCPNSRHECCPDFSCCKPSNAWPLEKRAEFAAADRKTQERMMVSALGEVLASNSHRVVISNGQGQIVEIKPRMPLPLRLLLLLLAGALTSKAIIYIALRVLG